MAKDTELLVTTTPGFEGRRIVTYKGLVGGDAILGANMFRDLFAGLRDLVGGRSGSYEKVLRAAKTEALEDMIASARESDLESCSNRSRPCPSTSLSAVSPTTPTTQAAMVQKANPAPRRVPIPRRRMANMQWCSRSAMGERYGGSRHDVQQT